MPKYLSIAQYETDRDLSNQAFEKVFNRVPNLEERQFVQAVGTAESSGGRGWKGEGRDSNNIGAIQAKPRNGPCRAGVEPDCDPATSFVTGDTHEDGTGYRCCYRRYPTRLDGWIDLVRTLYTGTHNGVDRDLVLRLASTGDFMGAVKVQRQSGYFELPLEQYQKKIDLIMFDMSEALSEEYQRPKAPSGSYSLEQLLSVPWLQYSVVTLRVQKEYNDWALENRTYPVLKEDGILGPKTAQALVRRLA